MKITSADKVLMILKAFSSSQHDLGNLELSEKLGFPKSTVNRLLHSLESAGFLEQNPATKRYLLGPTSNDIAKAVNQNYSSRLVSIAQPYIDELRDLSGETVGLEILSGGQTILIYAASGHNPIKVTFDINYKFPLHVAAGAKAILAFSTPEIVDGLIKRKLFRYTSKTITKPSIFKSQLKEIRKCGVAYDYGELYDDIFAVGAPVFDHEKKPIAGVVIALPNYRMDTRFKQKTIPKLKETAKKISSSLSRSSIKL